MAVGTVKWYNPTKRFGFLTPDDSENDIFIHVSALEAAGLHTLEENQRVEFELAERNGKTSAVNLKLVDAQ